MSDQCPSTIKPGPKQQPSKAELAARPRDLTRAVSGVHAWRSAEELADSPGFRDALEREFPAGVTQLFDSTRRTFLQVMGASLALAGLAGLPGCRRPDHKIMPYSAHVPEDIIPGKPLFYATSFPRPGGGAEGLLVETHEGRPTKLEGNPQHAINRGKSTIFTQAAILQLYDPDRLKNPVFRNPARGILEATWDDFRAWADPILAAHAQNQGADLAFVVEKKTSIARDAARDALLRRFPRARWVAYDAADETNLNAGATAAFGGPCQVLADLSRARVILSLDRDFLQHHDPIALPLARTLAPTRAPETNSDDMSRIYAVESGFGLVGGQADHRLRLSPSLITAFAVELARFMLPKLGDAGAAQVAAALSNLSLPALNESQRKFLEECAKDLMDPAKRGNTVVLCGRTQPAAVHTLCHALNAALQSKIVSVVPLPAEVAADSRAALKALSDEMRAGKIGTLFCINVNPVYDAPSDCDFAGALAKVRNSVTWSIGASETAAASLWSLNGTHFLECWGDTVSADGTIAPIQPMIAPLYDPAMCELSLLAYCASDRRDDGSLRDGYELVRRAWRNVLKITSDGDFESRWKRALHDGVVTGVNAWELAGNPRRAFDPAAAARALNGLTVAKNPEGTLEGVFTLGHLHDGRYANVPWLQELPQYGTQVVWDNPALMSPTTAERLGLSPTNFNPEDANRIYTEKYPSGRVAKFTLGGRTVDAAVWILPGMADDTVQFVVGYGRQAAGLVGDGVGFNVYPLLASDSGYIGQGVRVEATGDTHPVISTQNHWSLEGRTALVRALDLPGFRKYADLRVKHTDEIYGGGAGELNLAEKLGELSHTPPNISIYDNPYNRSAADADPGAIIPGPSDGPRYQQNTPPAFTVSPQYGMTIDLGKCTGCMACTIACQAENNIPVVGKKEVAKGRELTWIRVDRYFAGSYFSADNPGAIDYNDPQFMFHQPVACVHCENAPCETVCPVNATVHGPEGHNYMVYNRCIGTRYCANNCPYKVRRYNFFDYGVTKFNGAYYGKDIVESVAKHLPGQSGITGSTDHNVINPNLIPPRLRQKLDEISRMQKNPDVTVRSRGVMEKCTYCIQRTNAARIECKLNDLRGPDGHVFIPDGFVQTACQQACPSDAIVFGNILDKETSYQEPDQTPRKGSRVHAARTSARSYLLLGYLNTRPRTSHLARVMNPNPNLVADEARRARWEDPFGHGAHHGAPHADGHGAGPDAAPADHHNEHAAPKADGPVGFFDRKKLLGDESYALSLKVLA